MKRTIEDRLRKALKDHPGPWDVESCEHTCYACRRRTLYTVYDRNFDMCETRDEKDAEFLGSLHDLLVDALEEIEQLRARLAREQVEL